MAMLVEPATAPLGGDDESTDTRRAGAEADAWERFLLERARESASRPLGRWRDEEGL